MHKKGQGISLETIIVAAIVLVVLVVLWAIFTGRLSMFNRDLDNTTKGADCEKSCFSVSDSTGKTVKVYGIKSDINCPPGANLQVGVFANMGGNQVCCAGVGAGLNRGSC